ncbi:MAG: AAA family ATPase [Actinobacteria bacterium]|nr:AAA family ATPase [Actinomycetota bacterium]
MRGNTTAGEQPDAIGDLAPDGAAELVPRLRLLRRLREDRRRTLFLCAPSGYGKSVLLEQLAAADEREAPLVLLTPQHDDPTVLVESIAAALGRAEPFPEDVVDALRAPQPDLANVVVPRLLAAFRSRRRPFLLILDELERIGSPAAMTVVDALCKGMPPGSQLALAGRSEPALRFGRLRANRLLTELRREDLTMTRDECGALLAGLGLDLSPRQLDAIVLRTEGWPAALYLAGLAFGEEADLGRAIARFAGDDRVVVDYMREEFLLPVSSQWLVFLRQASVLERLSGPLCDATLGREGSAAALRELSRSNILLVPLDRKDQWYRFHPLLQDMLRAELRTTEAPTERELHLRASDWWGMQGDWDQAIHHAVEAGASAHAGELLWAASAEYLSRGRIATVVTWLDRLGKERVRTSAALSLTAAWTDLTLGRGPGGEYWAAVTRRLLRDEPSELKVPMEASLHLIEAVLGRQGVAAMRASVAQAEPLMPDESPWQTVCCLIDGVGLHLEGDRPAARERLLEGVRRGSIGAPNIQSVCLAQLAQLYAEEGDWRAAEAEAARARAQIDRYGLGDYPMTAIAFATSAMVRARRGAIDDAGSDLAAAVRLLGELDEFPVWYEIETRLSVARAAARLGDREAARRFLAEATGRLADLPDGDALARWIAEAEAATAGARARPGERLTPAELRVLRFLPTHRSFPQIAASLHLSPNTVKSHVRSIYGKFGVSSRQGAVEFARQAGLLDADPPSGGVPR